MGLPLQKYESGADDASVKEIVKIAKELTGVQLTDRHFAMITSRLQKRLQQLSLESFKDYVDYLKANWETEHQLLIGAVTTHHTFFLREFTHFEFLTSRILKEMIPKVLARSDQTLRIWSAASSRGQEVYSLGMVIQNAIAKDYPQAVGKIKIDILGTDIDPESVSIGKNGVYPWDELKGIPMNFLSSNWVRGTGDIANFAKAKASLRAVCRFEQQNLLDLKLKNEKQFDIIFCRNVFIYFDQTQIQSITKELLKNLNPEGFLFLGISESLHGLSLPIKNVGPSIYVKPIHPWVVSTAKLATPERSPAPTAGVAPIATSKIRVLVVDDSPSIHTLMKQIFTADLGFEIVGNATNGVEAATLLKTTKIDVMTLDIHMPVQDGVEYLRSNFTSSHPPVIMVSSVSREDTSLASQALEMGASDYVEKPALNQLQKRGEELRNKVRCAVNAAKSPARDLTLDQSFKASSAITQPEEKVRVWVIQGSDRKRLASMLTATLKENQPPTVLFFDSGLQGAEILINQFEKEIGIRFKGEADLVAGLKPKEVAAVFHSAGIDGALLKAFEKKSVVVLACGEPSDAAAQVFKIVKPLNGSNE